MSEVIDLSEFWAEQAVIVNEVNMAQDLLNAKKQKLADFNERARSSLISMIREGKSTGDPLQDECLTKLGFVKEDLKKVLAFNEKLLAGKGQECLLEFTWQLRIRYGGDVSPKDFMEAHGFILGILSGERLKLISDKGDLLFNTLEVLFPFSAYTTCGFASDVAGKKVGPLKLSSSFFEEQASALSFLMYLLKEQEGEAKCEVHFEDTKPRWPIIPMNYKGLKAILDGPTAEERHQGEHI